jgi:DNA-binding NtrC family response regulator
LATVYGIATQNHGFVSVSSEPERGTRFEIYLPGQVGETDPLPPPGATATPPQRGRETILLVEDEPAILEMTSMLLDHLGYTVLSASTPDEAIRLAQCHAGQIALLMTDVVMPEMNGRVLARPLNAMIPGLRCLFMSGYTADVIAPHGVLDPGVHFIEKPFSRDELASQLRTALEDRPLAPSVPLSENPDNP